MLRDEYFRRLVDGAHIELYLSAIDGARLYWPWRMQPPKDASDNYRNACERYIIDSDPLDDDVTTVDVLDCAYRLDAEVASLQDVYQDKDATVDSLLDGLEIADSHDFEGDLLLPLQKPYVNCWQELGEPTNHLLGIGGLKDGRPVERLKAARELRAAAGNDVWIHGFGWGVNGIADAIRKEPNLINSLDYSTPMQNAAHNDATSGDEVMSVAAMDAAKKLIHDLREVSEYPDQTATQQATL
jgi:hypothetical protein